MSRKFQEAADHSRPGHHRTVTGLWLYTLRELLDKLDELAGEHESQRPLRPHLLVPIATPDDI